MVDVLATNDIPAEININKVKQAIDSAFATVIEIQMLL
jgi:hypothetical protein